VNDDPKSDPPESEDGHASEKPLAEAGPPAQDRSGEENGGNGGDESAEQREVYTSQELEYLLDRFKSMAFLLTGDPEAETECSYCHQPVALGEALLTAHVAGVLAHIQCPAEHLAEVMQAAQPEPGFDFDGFVQAVDQRLGTERPEECHGTINVPDEPESPP
jgi:hypothetical protein